MQYETIILELLSRIKVLEEEVAAIKQTLSTSEPESEMPQEDHSDNSASRQKVNEAMIQLCYNYGKRLHEEGNLTELVAQVQAETGMNRNSAIMYLYAVSAMLGGTIYKRAISAKATKLYFDLILSEYGTSGLKKALHSAQLHIAYRKELGHTVDSIEALCDQYIQRL